MGAKSPPPLQQQATFWYTMASLIGLIILAAITGDPLVLTGIVPGLLGLSVQRVSGGTAAPPEERPARPTPPPAPPLSRRPSSRRAGTGLAVLLAAGLLALGATRCGPGLLTPEDAQLGTDIAELGCDGVDLVCDFAGDVAARVAPEDLGDVQSFCEKASPACSLGETVTAFVLHALSGGWSARSSALTMNDEYSHGIPADAGPLPAEVSRSGVTFGDREWAAACRYGLDEDLCRRVHDQVRDEGRAQVALVHRE